MSEDCVLIETTSNEVQLDPEMNVQVIADNQFDKVEQVLSTGLTGESDRRSGSKSTEKSTRKLADQSTDESAMESTNEPSYKRQKLGDHKSVDEDMEQSIKQLVEELSTKSSEIVANESKVIELIDCYENDTKTSSDLDDRIANDDKKSENDLNNNLIQPKESNKSDATKKRPIDIAKSDDESSLADKINQSEDDSEYSSSTEIEIVGEILGEKNSDFPFRMDKSFKEDDKRSKEDDKKSKDDKRSKSKHILKFKCLPFNATEDELKRFLKGKLDFNLNLTKKDGYSNLPCLILQVTGIRRTVFICIKSMVVQWVKHTLNSKAKSIWYIKMFCLFSF